MPRQFIPKHSSAHRIACIALYRALLFQCSRIELPVESFRGRVNPIKHLIRKQFRRNQHETSGGLVIAALKVGYEAEELLRSAGDGDELATSKVLSLLKEVQSEGDSDRARNSNRPLPSPASRPRRPEPYPDAAPVLKSRPRPLSELSGRRHVPILVSANGLPFLRFKKPQSPFLSRVLRNKRDQKQTRMDHVARMETDIGWAKEEDKWENLVGSDGWGAGDEESWQREMRQARKEFKMRIGGSDQKAREVAKKMLKIVDEERALFEKERKIRRAEKNRKNRERKEMKETLKESSESLMFGEGGREHVKGERGPEASK